ncbi:MAG TPA: PIG-L family deacetylase [Terriglobales bacterium]|nr:PIG-L family deacetylase [Terriglobales bacterium]
MLRLLCVTAHPDDEAGGFGGTLLLYASRGVETHVLCLTPGQAATNRGGARSNEELAAMRRAEFQASCRVLKIASGEVLDYPDAGLDRVDFHAAVGELTERIRRIRPHVILTIGPEGAVTAHPDHSMASLFTTLAYHWAGRSNRFTEQLQNGLTPHRAQKLYYSTTLFSLPDRQPVSPAPVTATIEIGAKFLDEKVRAFKQHTSQAPLFSLFEGMVRRRGTKELFHLAATTAPRPMQMETDLFEGVKED